MKNKFTLVICKINSNDLATAIPCQICNNVPSSIHSIICFSVGFCFARYRDRLGM